MKNTQSTIEKMRADADQGDVDAQFYIGYAHWNGNGVEKDMGAAMRWFRISPFLHR